MSRLTQRRDRIMREIDKALEEAAEVESVATVQRTEAVNARKALESARETLASIRTEAPTVQRDSRKIAGPAAIKAVESALQEIGRTTQAEITKATRKNSGTVTHALRALEAEGKAAKTGRRAKGSEEWAWTGVARRRESKGRGKREESALAAVASA